MHQSLLTVAIIGYVAATGLALAYLVQREELLHRLALLATLSAWVVHTVALLALAIDLGRPPLASMPEAVSVAVWVVVLLEMWIERRYGLSVLGAFVLPVALLFSLQSTPTRSLTSATPGGSRRSSRAAGCGCAAIWRPCWPAYARLPGKEARALRPGQPGRKAAAAVSWKAGTEEPARHQSL